MEFERIAGDLEDNADETLWVLLVSSRWSAQARRLWGADMTCKRIGAPSIDDMSTGVRDSLAELVRQERQVREIGVNTVSEMREWLLRLVAEAHQERELGVGVGDIDRWASERNVVLPADYRAALVEFAGAEFGYLEVTFRSAGFADYGRPMLLFSPAPDSSLYVRLDVGQTRMESAVEFQSQGRYGDWQNDLLPFAGSVAGWFCFDYRFDAESPPVVYVTDEVEWFPPPDVGMRDASGVSYVAASFTEFVGLMVSQELNPPTEGERRWEQARLDMLAATEPGASGDG